MFYNWNFRVLEIIILFLDNNNHVVENEMVQRMLGKFLLPGVNRINVPPNLFFIFEPACLFYWHPIHENSIWNSYFSQIPPFSRFDWFLSGLQKVVFVCTFYRAHIIWPVYYGPHNFWAQIFNHVKNYILGRCTNHSNEADTNMEHLMKVKSEGENVLDVLTQDF